MPQKVKLGRGVAADYAQPHPRSATLDLCSVHPPLKGQTGGQVSTQKELLTLRGDTLSYCIPDMKECGPHSTVSCEVQLNCQDFMETPCRCSQDYKPVFEKMFFIEPDDPCDGEKDPMSSTFSFIRFGIPNPFSRSSKR